MTRRCIHLLLATGLVLSALFSVTAAGATEERSAMSASEYDVFLPWVSHGGWLNGGGQLYGSLVVQNLEPVQIEAEVLVGKGQPLADDGSPGDWDQRRSMTLAPYQAVTLGASDLSIPHGTGASVIVRAVRTESVLLHNVVLPARIAAVVKNVGPVRGEGATTTRAHSEVDGYSGLTAGQVESATGKFILPIVQNNSGWETTVRIAHLGDVASYGDAEAEITVKLYEAGANALEGDVQDLTLGVRPGGVASFTLTEHIGAPGWVGSAVIESNVPLGAVAERVKQSDNMLVTVVSRPEQLGNGEQYAPLIFKDYNNWNTGISIANTNPDAENEITVTYYGPDLEEAGRETIRVAPRGMNFIHSPGGQSSEFGDGFVGSARITGTTGFHAVVDQVKYGGDGADVGQAMSYVLEPEASTFRSPPENLLGRIWNDLPGARTGTVMALPLVQRGDPATGSGDMSGIQLFNTSNEHSVRLEIVFYDTHGVPVAPTAARGSRNPMLVSLGANQSYTLYTPSLSDMPDDFQGSAVIEVTGGDGGVVGISNNVNYDVAGDGSAAYSLISVPPAWSVYDTLLCEILRLCE